ncbi:MAG: glycogen/starch/alpha-glucan family phosphorylase [Erysipelotrichales bacterium]|nr:glycogen/starch/alpha-glucan family phosphorylase [Erysipelotrichales bacterium]
MEKLLEEKVQSLYCKDIDSCSNAELYVALLHVTKETIAEREYNTGERKLYYISAEFLIGKLLSNNLINLGYYDEVNKVLAKHGRLLSDIEEMELEPSLGNGGLGRLAACFLDSIATLGLAGDGIGLNYHFGLFEQVFRDNLQCEEKNVWLTEDSWLNKTNVEFNVEFGKGTVRSKLYDIDVTGYNNKNNRLHLFDIETIDESLVHEGISFDKNDFKRNLTLFLYPDDSDDAGRLLRVYQQYFMVSNAAQLIIKETKERGYDLHDLDKHVCVQINDTHPSMVIPELIRLLGNEGIEFEEAQAIVSRTCAYTNHTILAEALEKWPLMYLMEVCPKIVPIIFKLDKKIAKKYDDEDLAIIDKWDRVHMAHMDMHYGYSVNGVASLHTDILKKNELHKFYEIYPEKFNNKTNGITFRRWLMHANPELNAYLASLIGEGYKKDADELEKLLAYKDDKKVLAKLEEIKRNNKLELKKYLKETQNIDVNENSIFDIQVKRLHEYKRQQMNALYIIYKYLDIKKGNKPTTPITMIFGSKAAPAYTIAKDIIHLLLCLQMLIENDPEVKPYLRVVVVENYNVTKATKLIPACDISEQISLASKEASGTGNMKFMLNGAVTIGTEDGANVEIHELVGEENIYIFGEESDTVIKHYENHDYVSRSYYENSEVIHELVDFIVSDELLAIGHKENLERLYNELLNKDWFMTLLDIESYIKCKETAIKDYEDREAWNKKSLVNIAKAGYFSSDRTIAEYNRDIWHLK